MNALRDYLQKTTELFAARKEAGGELSQDEEAERAEALDDLWQQLSDEERRRAEAFVEARKDEVE